MKLIHFPEAPPLQEFLLFHPKDYLPVLLGIFPNTPEKVRIESNRNNARQPHPGPARLLWRAHLPPLGSGWRYPTLMPTDWRRKPKMSFLLHPEGFIYSTHFLRSAHLHFLLNSPDGLWITYRWYLLPLAL